MQKLIKKTAKNLKGTMKRAYDEHIMIDRLHLISWLIILKFSDHKNELLKNSNTFPSAN